MTSEQSTSEHRFRITYQIVGQLRFLSHKELMRVIVRAFRRARLPLAYSHGYHPHPLFSFGPPRPVGMPGTAEQLDVRLTEFMQPSHVAERISAHMPAGTHVSRVAHVPLRGASITSLTRVAAYELEWPDMSESPVKAIENLLSRDEVWHCRRTAKGTRDVNMRPGIHDIQWRPPKLEMRLAHSADMYVRPQDVVAEMTGWTEDAIRRIVITRTGFHSSPAPPGSTLEDHETRDCYRHRRSPGASHSDS